MAFTKRTLSAVQGAKQYVARDLGDGTDGYPQILMSQALYSYATTDLLATVATAGYFGDCVPDGALVMVAVNDLTDPEAPVVTGYLGFVIAGVFTPLT